MTGASNSIGLKIARQLARRGHDLVLTGRSARTDEVADEPGRMVAVVTMKLMSSSPRSCAGLGTRER